ncbi:MAG TPA: serine/threonine-protein kinase [Kofleriaceae bacterium]|jgi:serine/threonine-protein kinase|nr:serine/threonine-protein kinase [Kofleriaceae bacterium]
MVDDDNDTVRGERAALPTLPGIGSHGVGDLGHATTSAGHTPPVRAALNPPVAQPLRVRHEMSKLPVGDIARYQLRHVLGEGGMGEVVLAYDKHIDREVAIKRIRNAAPTAEELARFVREARAQGSLEHPAVVPVHDLAVDRDGRPFFVMTRLSGTTMLELLARLRAGDEPDEAAARLRLLRAFVEVCLAVEFAHSRKIVHRDLKPANVMLGDFGEVYVLDWGVARPMTDVGLDAPVDAFDVEGPTSLSLVAPDLRLDTGDTQIGTVLGTPAYMAPEQLAGDRAGPAADIYSLGCILFEITAGVALHPEKRNVGEALTQPVARPSNYRPDAPPELDTICDLATRIEPHGRYRSARALGNAVQAFLDGDRDVSARAALAKEHIVRARAALSRGEDEAQRRIAMQAAGRALALDPTATEAADLVTHLMLKPPKHPPAEVEHRLEQIDIESAQHQGRLAASAMLGYLAFVPLMLWTGVRDPVFVVAFAVLALASVIHIITLSRRTDISRLRIYGNACLNAVLIGLVAHIVGPFIIAPTLAATTLIAYAAHPKLGRVPVMAAILGASVMVPWTLELCGVVAPTYRFTPGGELVLGSSVVRFSSGPVQIAFALLLVALLTVVGILSRGLARRQRDATRQLELQAWHLRQVVPSATPRTSSAH